MTRKSNTVRVEVESTHLIKGLKYAFSERVNVISELLQNARRSKATVVNIQFTADTLIVEDDGCGIEDFSKLIAIGGSGWDSFTVAEETPFGLGFMSSLFAASRVRVESKQMLLDADTSVLLAQQPVALQNHPDAPKRGTRITLFGHSLLMFDDSVRELTKGFPIPVNFNGKALARSHAPEQLALVNTSLGQLHFDPTLGIESNPILYLQGFRVSNGYYDGQRTILHLDPKRFIGRFPDRAVLANAADAHKVIEQELIALQSAFLTKRKSEMPADEFVAAYAGQCLGNGDAVLLNDLPFIPASWVSRLSDADMMLPQEWDHIGQPYTDNQKVVSIHEFQRGFCLSDDIDTEAGAPFDGPVFACKTHLPCVSSNDYGQLDMHHPLKQWRTDFAELTLEIHGETGRALVWLDDVYSVVACQSFTLTHPKLGSITIDDIALATCNSTSGGDMPAEANLLISPLSDSYVVRQTTRCLVEDSYDENEETGYRIAYTNAYAVAAGQGLATRLLIQCNQHLQLGTDFNGHQFTVAIGKTGKLTITETRKSTAKKPAIRNKRSQ